MNVDKSLSKDRIVSLYRYLSLFITSLLYFIVNENHSDLRKILIIVLLTITTIILNYLFSDTKNSVNKTKVLIIIESLGNVLILIPGGGLASPFVWYSLNTILIASIRLKYRYAWINLFVYIITATFITAYAQGNLTDVLIILKKESNVLMGLALITTLIQILTYLNEDLQQQKEKLLEANVRLVKANREAKDYLYFIMNIYECVEVLTTQQNEDSLKRMIIDYTKVITGSNEIAFISNQRRDQTSFAVEKSGCQDIDQKFIPLIEKNLGILMQDEIFIEANVVGSVYILNLVKNDYKIYGILCAELKYYNSTHSDSDLLNKIKFLSKVSAMGFGKIEVGELTEKLIADEERNRIADEIHDGVLQKLFSLSCYLFNVSKKISISENKTMERDIKKFRISLNVVIAELRETIYGLSTKKEGNDTFVDDINKLVNETKQLNDIDINFMSVGDFGLLTTNQKKAFYRIICESISNSVRHGNATKIDMELGVLIDHINLKIIDNGSGFNYEDMSEEKMGLGIRNMRHLIYSLNGTIEIKSRPGNGTKIIATVSKSGEYAS